MKIIQRIYKYYDRFMTLINLPSRYCSQCEKRIRHWVYHFDGLVYCQGCADDHVMDLELQAGFRA